MPVCILKFRYEGYRMRTNKKSSADTAYDRLKAMILTFALIPAQHLNEVALAEQLAVSRTPLREALNRLAAEGLLLSTGRGFIVPQLDPAVIQQLFEVRSEIECSIVRLVCERASDEGLQGLIDFMKHSAAASPDMAVDEMVQLDRYFHEELARLTGNDEFARILINLNDRIQLLRWIAMEGRRSITQNEHREILDALQRRDSAAAEALIRSHIIHRKVEIYNAVKRAYAHAHTLQFPEP